MIQAPYLLFLGDAKDPLSIKMARGVADWRPELCIGQFSLPGCEISLDLPKLTIAQAAQKGAKTFVLGFANSGGTIDPNWLPYIEQALRAGFDIVSGLHDRLIDFPQLTELAETHGCQLIDIRHPREKFKTGTGLPRSGKRLLTVGTDCSVGKMYTSLSIFNELQSRKIASSFRATGQCGVLIAGCGLAIDCVIADFIAGASEQLSPDNDPNHWDVIEGQGSLAHPAFAGVSLGLLHGSQPDAIVVCHALERSSMRGIQNRPLPDINSVIETNLSAAKVTNPNAKVVGISVNTSMVSQAQAQDYCDALSAQLNLPVVDPMRHGIASIVDKLS